MQISETFPRAEINVTPLVDIVLVLLIIFMVVTPLLQLGYGVELPKTSSTNPAPLEQIVIQVAQDGSVLLNRQPIALESLTSRLKDVLRNRAQKSVFFFADDSVDYGKALLVLDVVRNAGATPIGIGLETPTP